MKKITTLLVALLFAILCLNAALAMEGEYHWRDYTVEITQIEKNPMLVPASMSKDKYAIAVYLTIEESLWKNDTLCAEMYAEARLIDTAKNAYQPDGMMSGKDKPFLVFTFCVPKSVEAETLVFSLGESRINEDQADATANEAPCGDGSVTVTTASSDSLTLTPLESGAFQAQNDNVSVLTRLGTTVHNSGSQFLAGSSLMLSTMRNTRQYAMPMVAFRYQTTLETKAAADALSSIGKTAVLTMDGTGYPVRVLWVTEEMAAFIFDCPTLTNGVMRFCIKDNTLFIEP